MNLRRYSIIFLILFSLIFGTYSCTKPEIPKTNQPKPEQNDKPGDSEGDEGSDEDSDENGGGNGGGNEDTEADNDEFVMLFTNDFHSQIEPTDDDKGGVLRLKALVDSVRTAEPHVLLADAGDLVQGTYYFSLLNGVVESMIMDELDYDVRTIGNHEFDNGIAELARRLKNLRNDVVCANYDFTGTLLEGLVQPYTIVKKAGKKIGIIGLLTDLSEVVNSDIAEQMKYQHPVDVTNRYAKFLKEEKKCNLVICLTHLGFEDESYTDVMMAPLTRNVDIIVGGHSHTKLKEEARVKNLDGKDVIIVTDWKWGMKVGKLSVEL